MVKKIVTLKFRFLRKRYLILNQKLRNIKSEMSKTSRNLYIKRLLESYELVVSNVRFFFLKLFKDISLNNVYFAVKIFEIIGNRNSIFIVSYTK